MLRITGLKTNVKLKIFILLGAVMLSVCSSEAAEKYAAIQKGAKLNISDCIQIALKNSPLINKAYYNYHVSKNDEKIAKTAFFPTIGIGTGYTYNDMTSDRRFNYNNNNSYTAQATLSQLIFNFGKTNAQIKMQKFNKIAAMYNFDNVVLDTILGVKTYYYSVLAAKATVDINRANVQINERNYQRTKAYFDQGIRSKIDLVNAEVYLSDSKIALVQAENQYKNAMVQLNNSMYIAYAPEYEIKNTETFNFKRNEIPVNLEKISEKSNMTTLPKEVSDATLTSSVEKLNVMENFKFDPFPYTFEKSVEIAIDNRPDLKAYENTLKAMKQSLLYIKRQYYPTLSGTAGYTLRDSQYSTNSFNMGLTLNTSFNIMGLKNEIEAGKIQVDIAQNDIDLLKQNIYFEVQAAYINMIQLEKQIPLLAVSVKQTLENLELADGRYSVGIGDYIELQDAKVNYIQSKLNAQIAKSGLDRAVGRIDTITQ